MPESIAWGKREGVRVPIVRIVRRQSGPADRPLRVEIIRYTADGEVFDRTVNAPRRR